MNDNYHDILATTERIVSFWSSAHGWAPDSAADLLAKSRLDWHMSLTESLKIWLDKSELTDGEFILAWANIGTLIEGSMKILLSVHYADYATDIENFKKDNGKLVDPDNLALEKLRQFFKKKDIMPEWQEFIEDVQTKRNAIHAYKNRNIGTFEDFKSSVEQYANFLEEIDVHLPYP